MASFGDNIRTQIKLSGTITKLLAINIALFAVIRIINAFSELFVTPILTFDDVTSFLALPASFGSYIMKPWTLFTYMFLHWDVLHIFFNMLWLFWMGKIFQEFLGEKKLLGTYLQGGIAGAFFFAAAYNFFPLFTNVLPAAFALGASASVLAITVAAATLRPDYPIHLMLFGIVKLKWIALITIFLDLISISGPNAGGHIAHLGGALYGFIYIKQLQKGRDLSLWLMNFLDRISRKPRMRVVSEKKKKDEEFIITRKARQEKMDDILDKISKSGYGSLTQSERTSSSR